MDRGSDKNMTKLNDQQQVMFFSMLSTIGGLGFHGKPIDEIIANVEGLLHYLKTMKEINIGPADHKLDSTTKCPTCNEIIDGAMNAEPGNKAMPLPGDLTICGYCGEICMFQADMSLAVTDERDEEGLIEHLQKEIRQMMKGKPQ
jgi:hypothetical protein